jgi:hypothetical protein
MVKKDKETIEKVSSKALEDEEEIEEKEEETEEEKGNWKINLLLALGIFLLALLPRLYFLFFVSEPGDPGVAWYADTFHHWQIGYLTKTVGLSEGFLRLWDLKGLEFFWGLLHPLVLIVLFAITGSTDILIPRLLSTFTGVFSVVLLFLIAKRYFNLHVAFAAALLASLTPVAIYSDTSGMQEPLGIFLLLLGIWAWPKRVVLTGLAFALASMVRAEYWVFSVGLIGAIFLFGKSLERKIIALFAFGIPIVLYMKYLLDWTGNPIYPIYWNFLGNAAGEWQGSFLHPGAGMAKIILTITLIIAVIGVAWVLWKKPRGYLLLLLGFGNWIFLSVVIGWTAYLKSYVPRFWIDRIFLLGYMFAGLLAALLLFYWREGLFRRFNIRLILGWVVVVAIIVASQLLWKPIWHYYTHLPLSSQPTSLVWEREIQLAENIKKNYREGTVVIPEDRPILTYLLVNKQGFTGKQLVSKMYDPFFYYEEGDPFDDWGDFREEIFDWLEKHNIKLIVVYYSDDTYNEMFEREPEVFNKVKEWWINIYSVELPEEGYVDEEI